MAQVTTENTSPEISFDSILHNLGVVAQSAKKHTLQGLHKIVQGAANFIARRAEAIRKEQQHQFCSQENEKLEDLRRRVEEIEKQLGLAVKDETVEGFIPAASSKQ